MKATINTIVVGTDGSPQGEQAVRTAGEVAAAMGADPVHIVTACHRVSRLERQDVLSQVPQEFWESIDFDEDAERVLDEAARILAEYGIGAETHVIEERPTEALIDVAEWEDADLIVVGTRGLGTARRALHGSVSNKLLHHAPCAVLVAGKH